MGNLHHDHINLSLTIEATTVQCSYFTYYKETIQNRS